MSNLVLFLNKNIKKILIFLLFITSNIYFNKIYSRDTYLNILVHGTIRPRLSISDIGSVMTDDIEDTRYLYITEYLRNKSYYKKAQAIQDLSLQPINLTPTSYKHQLNSPGATALANIMNYQYKKINTHQRNLFYTFGWSGLLSAKERIKCSKDLHNKLRKLVTKYTALGIKPKIRLFGFSHGGTICLNLGNFEEDNKHKLNLNIEELILVGTPVHKETECLVDHPMFKKVYHFYSRGDMVQTSDYLSTPYYFCHWRFLNHKFCLWRNNKNNKSDFKVPNKLIQIESRITNDSDSYFNNIYHSPRHGELWSFGWAAHGYDDSFLLYPIPFITLTPAIINSLKNHLPKDTHDLVATVNSKTGKLDIKELKYSLHTKDRPFSAPLLTPKDLDNITEIAEEYRPHTHTHLELKKIALEAVKYALTKQDKDSEKNCQVPWFN